MSSTSKRQQHSRGNRADSKSARGVPNMRNRSVRGLGDYTPRDLLTQTARAPAPAPAPEARRAPAAPARATRAAPSAPSSARARRRPRGRPRAATRRRPTAAAARRRPAPAGRTRPPCPATPRRGPPPSNPASAPRALGRVSKSIDDLRRDFERLPEVLGVVRQSTDLAEGVGHARRGPPQAPLRHVQCSS